MKQLLIVLAFLAHSAFSQAQGEFDSVDALARNTQKSTYPTPEALTKALCKDLKTEREKARAIFTWVAENIRYTKVDEPNGSYPSQQAYDNKLVSQAYRGGKGVCMHYALLYKKMAEAVGLECAYITGACKKNLRSNGGGNHAWNAVKINGKWELLDVTWGAGTTDQDGFNKEFNPGFCFVAPRLFALDHFPDEAKWQLLDKPISQKQFQEQPVFYYGNPEKNIRDSEPFGLPLSKATDGSATLKIYLKNPPAVIELENKGRKVECIRSDKDGWVTLRFKAPYLREVEVWGGEKTRENGKIVVRTSLMGVFPLR